MNWNMSEKLRFFKKKNTDKFRKTKKGAQEVLEFKLENFLKVSTFNSPMSLQNVKIVW